MKWLRRARLIVRVKNEKIDTQKIGFLELSKNFISYLNEVNPYEYHYLIVETREPDKDIGDFGDIKLKSYLHSLTSIKDKIEEDEK